MMSVKRLIKVAVVSLPKSLVEWAFGRFGAPLRASRSPSTPRRQPSNRNPAVIRRLCHRTVPPARARRPICACSTSIHPISRSGRPCGTCFRSGGHSGAWSCSGWPAPSIFTCLSLAIPILIQRTIDNAIDGGDTSLLLPYLGLITLIAALRFGFNFTRRYSTAKIGIAVEARLRGMMYDAYLRYPRAFYDRHATGEVISRATNDIYPVRYFIGWGVVQAIQSVMMLIGAAIVLTSVNARLAL